MKSLFTNTSVLLKFLWQRDRLRIILWIASIIGISIAVAFSFQAFYPAGPERDIITETLNNPAMIAMIGPNYGYVDYHTGAAMASQMLLFTAIAVAIMNILLTIGQTRHDEERGRLEIIRSLPVGRLSNISATLLLLLQVNITMAILLAGGLGILGLEGMDWHGSLLYGAVLGLVGMFFAVLTALIAQFTESSRTALGFSFAILFSSYLLRALGDNGMESLSLISPLGLVLRTQAYVNNYWWPVLLLAAIIILITFLVLRFNMIRDLGAGLLPAKTGRENASLFLTRPWGLFLQLQKITIICWALGMFIMGASYGSLFGDIDLFFGTSDLYDLLLPGTVGFSLTDQFTVTLLALVTMFGTIPVLVLAFRIKTEEQQGRLENLLAGSVSRYAILGANLGIAVFASLLMQFMAVLGLWLATSIVIKDPYGFLWLLKGGLAYLPAYWVMIGLAALFIGLFPKRTGLLWVYLGYTLFVIYFGGLLRLPSWLKKLTPFGYIPDVPLVNMNISLTIIMLLIALGLTCIGLYGFRSRDIAG